jgi:hypothetical protein
MNEIPKLTRRRAVELAGAAGAAALLTGVKGPGRLLDSVGLDEAAQAATASCVLTPAKTEGPSNAVLATVAATHFHRNAAGRRVLRLKPEAAG